MVVEVLLLHCHYWSVSIHLQSPLFLLQDPDHRLTQLPCILWIHFCHCICLFDIHRYVRLIRIGDLGLHTFYM